MMPSANVNHTFDSSVVDVPNPFFAAVGHCANALKSPPLLLLTLNSQALRETLAPAMVPLKGLFEKLIATKTSSSAARRANETMRESSEFLIHSSEPRLKALLRRRHAMSCL